MAIGRTKLPDFFSEPSIDPVESATGKSQPAAEDGQRTSGKENPPGLVAKKKAGFYLSLDILERFTRKFHELKLDGIAIDNKSTLVELALELMLDDLDEGEGSRVLQKLRR